MQWRKRDIAFSMIFECKLLKPVFLLCEIWNVLSATHVNCCLGQMTHLPHIVLLLDYAVMDEFGEMWKQSVYSMYVLL